jgi:transcriptional antiterminator RfaH
MKYWFALLVKPRHEKAVSAALRSKHYEEFLPLRRMQRKWSDRVKVIEMPLLAGYTFCRFDPREKVHILRTPGVRKVVGWGATAVPVEEAEIEALQTVMRAGLPAAPCPFLRTGQEIRLDSGPLSGLCGLLRQSRGHSRLVVSITLLQRSVSVEVEQAWISPASWSEALKTSPANGEPSRGGVARPRNRDGEPSRAGRGLPPRGAPRPPASRSSSGVGGWLAAEELQGKQH